MPATNAEEAEGEWFHENLQDLTPKKDVLFSIGDWNAKVGSPETPGVTGKFGLGVQNEAGQRLIEFCQENTLVITNTLFQQNKRMVLVCFQGKLFNITAIQVYAPTTNAEEAEGEWFHENLQDLTPKKDVLFIIGDGNKKVGSQKNTWSKRKIWPWSIK